jgi:uncharacterized membrane protein YphA (DoxX/SURF4 family)
LLLLRLTLGTALICSAIASLSGKFLDPVITAQNVVGIPGGILLLAGLWTPLTGTVVALDEAWIALTFSPAQSSQTLTCAFFAVLALSIALLGPGAWSVDARLFGRRRFDIDRMREGKHPSKG